MNKRIWVAVAVGGLVGGGAALGFGPCVRSRIEDKAARYGAEVEIDHVLPSWSGVRLRGVSVRIAEIPGVSVWVDDMVVGWTDRRPRSTAGGRITAVGTLGDLGRRVDAWRSKYFGGGEAGAASGGGGALRLSGFELSWRSGDGPGAQTLHATGLRVERSDGTVSLGADSMEASAGRARVELEGGKLELRRVDGAYRVTAVGSEVLTLELGIDAGGAVAAGSASGEPAAPAASASAASSAERPEKGAPEGPTQTARHERVRAAKKIHALLLEGGRRLDALLAADADIDVRGARAKLAVGGDVLNLGPGTLSVVREKGDLVVALSPEMNGEGEGKSGYKTLTFSLRLPLAGAGGNAISGELRGGPIGLSLLGVREGDLGLKDVDQASIECDVRVALSPDGRSLELDGKGKLHQLALSSKRLAPEPLEGIELAWRGEIEAQLDGARVELRETEVDLGAIRGLLSGHYERHPGGDRVDLDVEMPLVGCQEAFDSIPKALVPKLVGMRFAGSLSLKGHARFDTAALDRHYDVDWTGTNSCRITDAPPALHPSRFKKPFEKLVYEPDGDETTMQFGPETDTWVPIGAIGRFMEGAVLTTEDGRFFRHDGFDKEAIVNSIRENLRSKRFVRGASTISMQLAKNLYLPRTKTISRKLQEAVLTLYLEQELTKQEIMELYLNVIEYGPMVYGIGPAARHYFNASPSRLSLGQSLYLASILSNPKQQHFGAGGAVTPGRMAYLRTLMKIVHKIKRITDDELEVGLRETVVFGAPSIMAPPEDDPYETAAEPEPDPLEAPPPEG